MNNAIDSSKDKAINNTIDNSLDRVFKRPDTWRGSDNHFGQYGLSANSCDNNPQKGTGNSIWIPLRR